MYNCPNCGGIRGQHSSVLQGCMCQWQMQAPVMQEGKDFTISKPWVGLTDKERNELWRDVVKWGDPSHDDVDLMKAIEAKLKEKNT